ncbi:MAG: NYN domain-containing protein [Verrucomicrobia bacterium]|nr:NYN domain-containing protein [Verrucomicrobiota bacterium]
MSPPARPSTDPAPLSRYLLVDGHSVLHAWPNLRSQHAQNPAAARQELIRHLATLHDSGRWRVTLVFDGQAGGKEEGARDSLAVLYASSGQTADSLIERIVQAHADKGEIGVVTADHAEMTAVESLGAFGFSPDWLLDELRVAGQELSESMARYRKKKLT